MSPHSRQLGVGLRSQYTTSRQAQTGPRHLVHKMNHAKGRKSQFYFSSHSVDKKPLAESVLPIGPGWLAEKGHRARRSSEIPNLAGALPSSCNRNKS